MGRLVKAFSKDDDDQDSPRSEDEFLRAAGEAVARIQQELRASGDGRVSGPQSPNSGSPSDERSAAAGGASPSPLTNRQLGRDVYSELDGEWARLGQDAPLTGVAGGEVPETLRLFVEPDDEQETPAEPTEGSASADAIRKELMEELVQEQERWTERHAMQVRTIEEQTQQIARAEAEVELREQELDRRERELDARTRELAAKAGTEVRSRSSRDWESSQKEINRLTSDLRMHADRASQFEAELAEVRREYAAEVDELRSRLNLHDDSRADRARSVIEECDQRMSELTAQRAAWQAEQSRRREELARERLEQRDELRQQREKLLAEHKAAQEAFEKERDSTIARLDLERREWNAKFNREQDELLDLKQAVNKEAERIRGDVSREKAEWASHQEQMRIAHREDQAKQQELLDARMTEAEQLKKEHAATFARLQKEFESEREAWHRERGQEAAILQAERNELETEANRLRTERSLVEAKRQQLSAELEQQRSAHNESLRQSWRDHQSSMQQAEQESTNRQRILAENLQQRENELSARFKQAEHEIRTARELSSRQISQEKERFVQTCTAREAELEQARAALNVQRQQFEREKLEFADETARTRQKIEQERSAIRSSLSQMDVQLRAVAASLLPGVPVDVAASGLVGHLNSLVNAADQSTADRMKNVEQTSKPKVVNASTTDSRNVSAWEPGKEATLVESISNDLIRRLDPAAEQGGVSGLEKRPRIASHGVLAEAASDAMKAEVVYDDNQRHPEWAGIVETRTDDDAVGAVAAEQSDGRRQALESYRSKLSSLRDQLRQLSSSSRDSSSGDEPADAES